jgi:DNA-binding transcriptional MerR regulator
MRSRVDTSHGAKQRFQSSSFRRPREGLGGESRHDSTLYERIGVLPRASRTDSGYRVDPASAVERVLVVKRALRIGFTLAELGEILKARDAGGAPCSHVYQLAQDKLKGIEADIEALKQTRRYVKIYAFVVLDLPKRLTGPVL